MQTQRPTANFYVNTATAPAPTFTQAAVQAKWGGERGHGWEKWGCEWPAASWSDFAWLLLFVLVTLLIIKLAVPWRCISTSAGETKPLKTLREKHVRISQSGKRITAPSSLHFAPITRAVAATGVPPVAPLWWDDDEGAYMIQLRVGGGNVEFVLDTGSSQLSAKGPGCRWTNCGEGGTGENGGACTTRSCPCGNDENGDPRTDCSDHYYISQGKPLRPGEGGAGTSTTLTYGSQQDTVSHVVDAVSLPHTVDVTCARILTGDAPTGPLNLTGLVGGAAHHSLGNIVVHQVSHIQGTSSSNLLGMACPHDFNSDSNSRYTDEGGTHVVLEKLFGGYDAQWSVVFRPTGGWWAMGPLTCFGPVQYVQLASPRQFELFVTKFYILPVLSVSVGARASHMTTLPRSACPRYCIVDTGTTYTYGPVSFGKALKKSGWDERRSFFRIALGTRKQHATITYTPEQMRDPEFPDSSVLQVDPGRTLDDYDDIFPPNTSCILFGAMMMCNMYWEFDLAHRRVGIHALPS